MKILMTEAKQQFWKTCVTLIKSATHETGHYAKQFN